jgi:uncharacterized protein with HEPN domain
MLRYARIGGTLIAGVTRETLEDDLVTTLALTKAVEIVGEAASQVTRGTRAEYKQLPWKAMIGMRNILVHEYFAVDLDVLWVTARQYLPPLIISLEAALTRDEDVEDD